MYHTPTIRFQYRIIVIRYHTMVLCNTPKTVLLQVYLEEDIDLTVRRVDYPNSVGIVLAK